MFWKDDNTLNYWIQFNIIYLFKERQNSKQEYNKTHLMIYQNVIMHMAIYNTGVLFWQVMINFIKTNLRFQIFALFPNC